MLRIRIVYFILITALLSVFHNFTMADKIPFVFINVVFLAMATGIFMFPPFFLGVLLFLSWIIMLPLFIVTYKTCPSVAAMPLFIFSLFILGGLAHKKVISGMGELWNSGISEDEDLKKAKLLQFEKLVFLESEIKAKEHKIVSLYEITKKMSGSLKYEDIFNVLSSFLKDNFTFRKCELAIFKRNAPEPKIDKSYSVWRDRKEGDYDYKINYEVLLRMLSEKPQATYFTRERDKQVFKDVGVEDDEVHGFIVIPLLSEKRIVALLVLDNLLKADIEKFIILAAQFALEIKKVLLYETVEELAITDGLTGLFVRRYFLERLDEELYRSKRYKFKFAFLMLDIDDFKNCNDTYGHLVGDVVLKEVGRLVKDSVREIDLVSRYGGEELAVVLPESSREGAQLVAERIRKRIAENVFKAYDEKVGITVSIGVAIFPDDALDAKGVIEKADAALYVAKKAGKNIVC
ncbi:MAG: sensor domain-containing diguanylate cyclase [Candidatus Omnitrophota bacterium]